MDKRHEDFAKAIAAELRAERAAQQATYEALAERMDSNPGTLYKYFSGKRALPLGTFSAVCDALGVDPMTIGQRAQQRLQERGGQDS